MVSNKNVINSQIIRNFQITSQILDLESKRKEILNKIKQKRHVEEKDEGKKKKKEKKDKKKNASSEIDNIDDHRIEWNKLYEKLSITKEVITTGLTTEDANERSLKYGENKLADKKKQHWSILLIKELTNPFAIMLWLGALLCIIAFLLDRNDPSNLYLGIVLAFVVSLTGIVTFFQNSKSDSIMASFKNFIPPKSNVYRNGKLDKIDATKLVPGDIIVVKIGERIPADIRIIESKDMKVDNSSLTGESDPLLRSDICDFPEKILETKNVAFFGTLCKEGEGKGIVFNIGQKTIIGNIANLSDSSETNITPLRAELNRFIAMITIIALVLGVIFFFSGFALGYTLIQNLVFAIGIIVANVPEGLLATITITLTVASVKLSKKKVLVKNLESVETLGSTSCICSDKTGTLTQNKMTVENLWYNLNIVKGDNKEKWGAKFKYKYDDKEETFKWLHNCAVINSTAFFSNSLPEADVKKVTTLKEKKEKNFEQKIKDIENAWDEKLKTLPYYEREVNGDASETALIKFYQPINDILQTREIYNLAPTLDDKAVIPFNSSHKFTLRVFKIDIEDYSFVSLLKGAPERVWAKCKYIMIDGKQQLIDENIINKFNEANKVFAINGERVLGFAAQFLKTSHYPKDHKFNFKGPLDTGIPDEYCFLGLISLIDPPRDSVPEAIKKCKTAGVKVIMVTGDQQLTAASIAKKIGIFDGKSSIDLAEELNIPNEKAIEECEAIVVNGDMLKQAELEDSGLPEEEKGKKLEKWLKKPQIVFARTSPAQKLYIVKGCQKLGYIVAVTGDGVNDSPAIKQADIGISMGITGTEVAKDSADMILLNDDFGNIIAGIEEGRKIFDNLKKSIAYTLTSNIPEIIPFLTFIILLIPLPLSTVLILCVDWGTDIFPAVSFAFEDSELDIMTRLPRKPYEHLVSHKMLTFSYLQMGMIQTFGCFISYFMVMNEFGFPPLSLLYILNKPYYPHNPNDIYDPSKPFYGNTNVESTSGGGLRLINVLNRETFTGVNGGLHTNLDWLFTNDLDQDLRMGYLKNVNGIVQQNVSFGACHVNQISPVSLRPVCFSTEALKYAQTSFFFCICLTQFSNTLSCKTRKLSIIFQGMKNYFMIFGWASEAFLTIVLAYINVINLVFGTRDLLFYYFALPCVPFSILMLVYDEVRKYLIRKPNKFGKPSWFENNWLW